MDFDVVACGGGVGFLAAYFRRIDTGLAEERRESFEGDEVEDWFVRSS